MQNTKITRSAALGLALALTTALGACGQMSGSETTEPATGTNQPTKTVTATATAAPETSSSSSSSTEEAEPEPEPSLTGTDPGILQLGESFTYSDGLQITIGKATPVSTEYGPAVSFDVTLVNGTQTGYDPSMDYFSAQLANTEGEEVFDFENGYEGTPSTTILPGRESVYKIAFEGSETSDIVLEYTPGDFERGALIFTPDGK